MRTAVRLVLVTVFVLAAIVVVQRISAGRFEADYRARLVAAQEAGLLPQTNRRNAQMMRAFRSETVAVAPLLGTLDEARAAELLAGVRGLDEQALSLMGGPFVVQQDSAAGAPRIELAAEYFAALDALDLGGPDEPSAGLTPAPQFLANSAHWLAGVDAERLAREAGGGALAARRLAQVFALHYHVDEGCWERLSMQIEREEELLDSIVRATLQPHADPRALFAELDPWLARCASVERFVAALRGEFLREYDVELLPFTWRNTVDAGAVTDQEWRRARCRLECLEDCVRGLTLPGGHVDQPERRVDGRIVPPRPPGGDPTHELVDIERAGQRHRRMLTLARVALAIAAYEAAEGVYPAALSDLGKLFEGPVPVDPADGQPFGYRVEPGRSIVRARRVGGPQFEFASHASWEQRAR